MQCTKPAQSPAQSPGAGVRGPCLPKGSHQGKKRGLVMEIFRKGGGGTPSKGSSFQKNVKMLLI